MSHPALNSASGFTALAANSEMIIAGSNNGHVYLSNDSGASWQEVNQSSTGSTLVWALFPSQQTSRFYAAMWGGGGLLTVNQDSATLSPSDVLEF